MKQGDKITIYSKDEIKELMNDYSSNKDNFSPDISIINPPNIPKPAGTIKELIRGLVVKIEGEVAKPGDILLGGLFSIKSIIDIAGGTTNIADLSNVNLFIPEDNNQTSIEINQFNFNFLSEDINKIKVLPGTLISIPDVINDFKLGFVEISGEVFQPGLYRILKEDNIFSILKRSGGLNKDAFMRGMVFTREMEKEREIKSIDRLSRELDKAISLAVELKGSDKIDTASLNALRSLANDAASFEALGRVVGDFSSIESLKSTKIISGDRIFIPSTPSSITIVGEVMTPGSMVWKKNIKINEYIKKAAGFTQLADKDKIFIIDPNGQSYRTSGLWTENKLISPGSTIVVPRRIQFSTALERVSSITSVIYQLTLSLAGIRSVLDN